MSIFTIIVSVLGLSLFEIISSVDNAIINAEVLGTMKPRARKWFLVWGLLTGVFIVRGLLPLLIVWLTSPGYSLFEVVGATFSGNREVVESIEKTAPMLLMGGGIFMIFVFFHWIFLEPKRYGLPGEKFIFSQGVWFYATVSIILTIVVWQSLKINPLLAFSAVVGSTAFFITHGFKQQAEMAEKSLMKKSLPARLVDDSAKRAGRQGMSDISKILYLEVIDATFSIDGVIGAFAFTLSVPIILLGNGLGAIVLRKLTISNIDRIKTLVYLKNGAMYSIFFLGLVMVMDAFGVHIPQYISPVITFILVIFFYLKSRKERDSKIT